MNPLAYPTASLADLQSALQEVTRRMHFPRIEDCPTPSFEPSLEARFFGILADAVVKSYAGWINKSRHYHLRLNYLAKQDQFQRLALLSDNLEQTLLERAREKLPRACHRHPDLNQFVQFFLRSTQDHCPFRAQKMAITGGELHLYDRRFEGPGYRVARGCYRSGCLYPDLWLDHTLLEIKCYRAPTPSPADLSQLLGYYALINHRLERNGEGERLVRSRTTLRLPPVEHLGFFFARQGTTLLFSLKGIADQATWNRFASLYYYSLLIDRREAQQHLTFLLSNCLVPPQRAVGSGRG